MGGHSSKSQTEAGHLAYSPFGINYAGSGPNDFAGHRTDTPDNLDDSPDRLLAPMMARWLSPDPSGLAAVNPASPQSWNQYAYVGNQPLSETDPLGLLEPCCQFTLGLSFNAFNAIQIEMYQFDESLSLLTGPGLGDGVGEFANAPSSVSFLEGLPGGADFFSPAVGGPLEPAMPSGGGGAAGGGSGLGGRITWAPFGQDAWIGVPPIQSLQVDADPAVGMDIWHCPGCALTWQNSDGAIHALFYGTLGEISLGVGDAMAGAAEAVSTSSDSAGAWLAQVSGEAPSLASELGSFVRGAVPGGTITATWGGAVALGLKTCQQASQCPPWEAGCW